MQVAELKHQLKQEVEAPGAMQQRQAARAAEVATLQASMKFIICPADPTLGLH